MPKVPALLLAFCLAASPFASHPKDAPIPAVNEAGAEGGWVDLFDGQSLAGWTQRNGTAKFVVEGKTIKGTTSKGSPNSFLCTDRFYGDFELEFDVKVSHEKLNSGVQIRSHVDPTFKEGRVHGPQVEIAANGNAGFIFSEAGGRWLSEDREDPEAAAAYRAGEWNRFRVICFGQQIRTWVNGTPVADVIESSWPTGFIGLQVHAVQGDPSWSVVWKNLRLRELGDGGGYAQLFNGKDLAGWTVNEDAESFRVEKGNLVVNGKRAHAFYSGPVCKHSFKNFELRAVVQTKPEANSGLYFHTEFQEEGWPAKGYEVQVNNTQSDWRRTGGLYGIEDLREAPAEDGQWFVMSVRVEGRRIAVAVDGEPLIDYTEPEKAKREPSFAGRLLGRGTFALQAHDPGSEVWFKSIAVKPLPE